LCVWSIFITYYNSFISIQVTDITGWIEKNNKIQDKSQHAKGRIWLSNYTATFSVFQTSNFEVFDRLNIQKDSGQAIYDNRTLAHNL
jgi:hypothetical protein